MLKRLTISFTTEEREALDRLAREDLRPVKDQVRVLIREAAQKRGVWPLPAAAATPSAADRAREAVTP